MSAAENRSKTDKGKQNARLRVLNVALQSPHESDAPRRFRDPAAPKPKTVDVNNTDANEIVLGDDFAGL